MSTLGEDAEYSAGVQQVARTVADWLKAHDHSPRFRFPPFALIADLEQVGHALAVTEEARELVDLLKRRVFERTGRYPTVLQLQAALDVFKVPYETCTLSDLGLQVGTA